MTVSSPEELSFLLTEMGKFFASTACVTLLRYLRNINIACSAMGMENDARPIRPDEAFARRYGLLGYGPVQDGDSRVIYNFISADRHWTSSCNSI